jgi:hypothetical protein
MGGGRDADEGGCDVGTLSVSIDHVDKARDPSKVNDGVVVIDRDRGEVVGCGVGESGDSGHDIICPSLYGVRE